MLSQRQIEILLEYCNHPGEYYTGNWFANHYDVSLRTIQGDMKAIRTELEEETCMEFVSKTAKGSAIIVKDHDEFTAYVNAIYQDMTTMNLNYPVNRISKILLNILEATRALKLSAMEDEFYISKSTLANDLKSVEGILEQYDLVLLKGGNRVALDGQEMNKRHCIMEQNLYLEHVRNSEGRMYIDERQINKIKNVVTEVYVKHKYTIQDIDFNNLVLFINVLLVRVEDGFYIQASEVQNIEEGKDYLLAKDLCKSLSSRFFLPISDNEVRYLTIYLRGISNESNPEAIPADVDAFVQHSFELIFQKYGFDFTNNLNLRITLALHTISLNTRLLYDMQIKNDMLEYIRESFPLGYEIGSFYGYELTKKTNKKVTDDELALLAIHFYSALMDENRKKDKACVLIFSSLKNSLSLLLKQLLLRWFPDDIGKVDFANEYDFDEDALDDYEIFLTTDKGEMYKNNLAMYINPFPERNDYFNVKLLIDGFKSVDDILGMFHPELFKSVLQIKKEDALMELIQKSTEYFHLENFEEEVFLREKIASTYFTKGIAMAHPATAVSSDTFISVLYSKKPIVWDEDGNRVNLIMLMQIGKNNPRAFQLWKYMAKMFSDRTFVEKVSYNPVYDNFISLVKEVLQNKIDED